MKISIKGKEFEVANQPSDFWQWVKEGCYDSEWDAIQQYLRPEHTFLDVGAWVGSHSLFASTICKRVISIEPDPVAFPILRENTKDHANIECRRIALTNYEGTLRLGAAVLGDSVTRTNPHQHATAGAWTLEQAFCVPCLPISKFVEWDDPLFIKMDVEGSEEAILQDEFFFASRLPILYLETHPFWWKNEQATQLQIHRISRLYNTVLKQGNRILMVP